MLARKKTYSKVGLYIPGGTAPLFSTVLMLAVPLLLQVAKRIVLCSPPNKRKY
jgi:histidinol dehydrogenase